MIVIHLIFSLIAIAGSFASPEEKNLRNYLQAQFPYYNSNLRPVKNSKSVLNVENKIKIIKLFYLDEINHKVTLNAILVQRWKDELLSWNPSNFSSIEYIYMKHEKLWTPKLTIVSKYSGDKNDAQANDNYYEDYQLKLRYDGQVEFVPTVHLTTNCLLNYANFPLDVQMCSFMFQMPYNRNQVNFTVDTYLIEQTTNTLWDVISIEYFDKIDPYDMPIEDLLVILKRKTKNYLNFIPSYLIYIMTLIMFLLPTHSSQRILIGSICLVITTLLVYSLANSLPNDDIAAWPLIGKLYLFNAILIAFSLIFSSFIINVSQTNHFKSVPFWVKQIVVNVFSRLFCVQTIAFSVFNSLNRQAYDEDVIDDQQGSIELSNREQQISNTQQQDSTNMYTLLKGIHQHLLQIQYGQQKRVI